MIVGTFENEHSILKCFPFGDLKPQMFVEGSVFSGLPQGELADVTPGKCTDHLDKVIGHKVYRSGICLSLPIKIQGNNNGCI
jgi:CRISPR-associated protein Csm4